ncbi:MAG: hypothetical protein PHU36_08300, partial [Syntrophomonadaceae bacterium]|nr:hypothetical protein [Syntrophomonadaceae bacterium]
INIFLAEENREDADNQEAMKWAAQIFCELGSVLGIFVKTTVDSNHLGEKLLPIFGRLRTNARQEKKYSLADSLRDWLSENGIIIEDQQEGSRFRYDDLPDSRILIEKLLWLRTEFKKEKLYAKADFIRDSLQEQGIIIEDTREGVRFKFADN